MYDELFEACEITDIELRDQLAKFVNNEGDLDENVANRLNNEENLQRFVEKAFAKKFAPLQNEIMPVEQPTEH